MKKLNQFPSVAFREGDAVTTVTLMDPDADQKEFSEAFEWLIKSGISEHIVECAMRHLDEFTDEEVLFLKAMNHD